MEEIKNSKVENEDEKWHKITGELFLAGVTGMSILFGFGMTLAMARKRDPSFFAKGIMPSTELPESGGSLAMRALGRATLYSVTGFGLFLCASWKMLGLHNIKELPEKMKSIMPSVPQQKSEGRTEFKSIRELLQYIIDESDKGKKS